MNELDFSDFGFVSENDDNTVWSKNEKDGTVSKLYFMSRMLGGVYQYFENYNTNKERIIIEDSPQEVYEHLNFLDRDRKIESILDE